MAPMMTPIRITDEQFSEIFKPKKNHICDDNGWDGCLYEIYGPELEYVQGLNQSMPAYVWTIVDTDKGMIVVNGYRVMDRTGYLITTIAGPDSFLIEVYDPDEYQLNQEGQN